MQKSTNMSIKMTFWASTQINVFLCTIFSFEFFGWSLKNLRNVKFLAEKWPWVFLTLSFFGLEFFENGQKKSLVYSMPQTVWNTENVSKWTSNVQLLCSTASTYWIIYSWLTSNPKISIWVHTRAKIHSFSKCQNSDHFWGCEKSILQIQPDHNETCL